MPVRNITGYRLVCNVAGVIEARATEFVLRPHRGGCYRTAVPNREELFAQIKRAGNLWLVEIRDKASGELRRYAGKWKTLKDACDEIILVGG